MKKLVLLAFCLLAHPLLAASRTWTGAASANWSNPANWSPAGVPAAGESLVFPSGAANKTMVNDVTSMSVHDLAAGFTIGSIDFNDQYTLQGNALTMTGDLTSGPGVARFIFRTPVTLGAPVNMRGADERFATGLNVNGKTLTLGDQGTTYVTGSLDGTGSIVGTATGGADHPSATTGRCTRLCRRLRRQRRLRAEQRHHPAERRQPAALHPRYAGGRGRS